jgi:hypothetical protein
MAARITHTEIDSRETHRAHTPHVLPDVHIHTHAHIHPRTALTYLVHETGLQVGRIPSEQRKETGIVSLHHRIGHSEGQTQRWLLAHVRWQCVYACEDL